jgi:hypothetical protein
MHGAWHQLGQRQGCTSGRSGAGPSRQTQQMGSSWAWRGAAGRGGGRGVAGGAAGGAAVRRRRARRACVRGRARQGRRRRGRPRARAAPLASPRRPARPRGPSWASPLAPGRAPGAGGAPGARGGPRGRPRTWRASRAGARPRGRRRSPRTSAVMLTAARAPGGACLGRDAMSEADHSRAPAARREARFTACNAAAEAPGGRGGAGAGPGKGGFVLGGARVWVWVGRDGFGVMRGLCLSRRAGERGGQSVADILPASAPRPQRASDRPRATWACGKRHGNATGRARGPRGPGAAVRAPEATRGGGCLGLGQAPLRAAGARDAQAGRGRSRCGAADPPRAPARGACGPRRGMGRGSGRASPDRQPRTPQHHNSSFGCDPALRVHHSRPRSMDEGAAWPLPRPRRARARARAHSASQLPGRAGARAPPRDERARVAVQGAADARVAAARAAPAWVATPCRRLITPGPPPHDVRRALRPATRPRRRQGAGAARVPAGARGALCLGARGCGCGSGAMVSAS